MDTAKTLVLASIAAAMLAGLVYRPDGTVKVLGALFAPFKVAVKGASGGYAK